MRVETQSWSAVPAATRLACAALWEQVWPSGDTADLEARLTKMEANHPAHQVHFAIDGAGQVVAVARTFEHTIGYGDNERPIIALASVCSNPDRRGEGFGDAVVRAAFERVDASGVPALFQTPVPDFYDRFGSRLIDNDIFTSKPGANSFDDPWAMIYPAQTDWGDTQPIDLRTDGW